jgi:hypothetical protein
MIDMQMVEKVAKISNIHDFIINELPRARHCYRGEGHKVKRWPEAEDRCERHTMIRHSVFDEQARWMG